MANRSSCTTFTGRRRRTVAINRALAPGTLATQPRKSFVSGRVEHVRPRIGASLDFWRLRLCHVAQLSAERTGRADVWSSTRHRCSREVDPRFRSAKPAGYSHDLDEQGRIRSRPEPVQRAAALLIRRRWHLPTVGPPETVGSASLLFRGRRGSDPAADGDQLGASTARRDGVVSQPTWYFCDTRKGEQHDQAVEPRRRTGSSTLVLAYRVADERPLHRPQQCERSAQDANLARGQAE